VALIADDTIALCSITVKALAFKLRKLHHFAALLHIVLKKPSHPVDMPPLKRADNKPRVSLFFISQTCTVKDLFPYPSVAIPVLNSGIICEQPRLLGDFCNKLTSHDLYHKN
jgi:hypothetical protein